MLKTLNKYIDQIIPLLLTVILLSSCFVHDSSLFSGNITAKYFWVQLSGVLVMVFIGVKLLFHKGVDISFIDIFIALIVLWITGRDLFSEMPYGNSQQNLILIVTYFVLYIFLRQVSNQTSIIRLFFIIYLSIVSVQAIVGLLQVYGLMYSHHSLFNITGSFHNPGPFAGYILSGVPMALGLYLTTKKTNIVEQELVESTSKFAITSCKTNVFNQIRALNSRILLNYYSQFVLVVLLVALSATHSRAAWLGALASSLYILWSFRTEFEKSYGRQLLLLKINALQKKVITVSVGFIIIAALFGLYKFKQGSADGRLLMWQVSWEMIKDKPLLGWGAGGFEAKYGDYQAEWFKSGKGTVEQEMVAGMPDAPFNEIIRIAVAYGAIGLLLSLGILVVLFFKKVKRYQNQLNPTESIAVLLKGALLSVLCFSLFSYTLDIAPIVMQIVLLSTLIAGLQANEKSIFPVFVPRRFKLVLAKVVGIILIVLLPFLAKNTWQQYKGYQCWKEAYQLYQYQIYDDAAEEYQKASGYLPNNGLLLQMHGKCLLMGEQWDDAKRVLEKAKLYRSDPILYTALADTYKALKEYDKAEREYLQAWQIIPHKFYPKYLLAKLYDETGQKTKARGIAKELLSKEVKVASQAIEEMRDELKRLFCK